MPGRQLTYHSQTTVKGFPVNRPIDHEWTCRLVVWKCFAGRAIGRDLPPAEDALVSQLKASIKS